MPKRVATPPPGDDEPKYLTVNQPYPLNAHWELPNDRIEFARWIACCIGTKPFYAFLHKPRSRGMVILEIERSYTGFDGLLGEHRWNEFLKNPSDEEKDRVSQVFYCRHKSDREVQKHGWKRINIEDGWFKDWSPTNGIISYPYPSTHWCNIPSEDRTNEPLCRPLPVKDAPPPPPPVVPLVVGSPVWVTARATNAPSLSSARVVRGARGRGAPTTLTIPTRGGAKSATPVRKSLASNASNVPTSPHNAWNKAVPSSSSTTASWSPWSSRTDTSSPASSTENQSASPPSLSPQPGPRNPTKISWADDSPTSASHDWWDSAPPGLERTHQDNTSGPSQSDLSSSAPNNNNNTHLEPTDAIGVAMAIENLAIDESLDPALTYVAPWEQAQVDRVPPWPGARVRIPEKEEVLESLWDNEEEKKKQEAPQAVCSAHGVICKKGICQEYAKQLKEAKRESERLDREKAAAAAKGKRKRRGTGNGKEEGFSGARGDGTDSNSNKNGSDDGAPAVTSSNSWRRGDGRAHRNDETASTMDDDGASSAWSVNKGGKGRNRAWGSSVGSSKV